jgi:osmotically-inducible protein OsmY
MKRKLLAVMIATMLAAPAAVYAQGTTAPKDTGMTKDRPAASGSATTRSDTTVRTDTSARSKDGSPDAVITGKIKSGFIKDKIVRSRNYNVDTSGGVVTVKGKARSQAEADRALEIAKSTSGVSSVKNEIQVIASADQPKRDSTTAKRDTTTRRDTTTAATGEPRNSTPTSEQPKKSTTAASGGASTSASKEGSSPDALITTKIKSEYAMDKTVGATRISVETNKGVVTLGGMAKSKAEVDQAVALAKNVKGVTSVKNNIKVEAK